MTAFKLMAATTAMASLLAMLANGREPPPAPVPDAITERWPDDNLPAAAKTDRLALPPAPAPATVEPPVDVAAARIDEPQTVGTTASVRRHTTIRRHTTRNICTRHGMRKVITRGGKSWRCRR